MIMKRLSILFVAASILLVASCSPETFSMNIEMRYPSRSGIDLTRKSMAVVAVDSGDASDTTFMSAVAEGFATKMEEEYYGGKSVIDIYRVPSISGSSVKSFAQDLIMDTNRDVVFLFDRTEFGGIATGDRKQNRLATNPDSAYITDAALPFRLKMSVYNSLDTLDKVYSYSGASSVRCDVYNDGTSSAVERNIWDSSVSEAVKVGSRAAANFLNTWKTETYTFYYFETLSSDWDEASQAAYEYRWTDAVRKWTSIFKNSSDSRKKACAAYDIATACYMLEEYPLALQWLDMADSLCSLSLSPGLRKRINSRIQ